MKLHDFVLLNKNFTELNPKVAGYHECDPLHDHHCLREYWLIHCVISGKGRITYNDETYEVTEGQAFIIAPGEYAYYCADKKDPWYYIYIGFDGKACGELKNLDSKIIDIDKRLFLNLLDAENYSSMREEYVAGRAMIILSSLLDNGKTTDVIGSVRDYIDAYFMYKLKVSDIADMMNLNRKYLTRKFKEKNGVSIKEYITITKMSAAKKYLKSGKNVNETAFLVGFDDPFSFSKAFKAFFGQPPVKYISGKI